MPRNEVLLVEALVLIGFMPRNKFLLAEALVLEVLMPCNKVLSVEVLVLARIKDLVVPVVDTDQFWVEVITGVLLDFRDQILEQYLVHNMKAVLDSNPSLI